MIDDIMALIFDIDSVTFELTEGKIAREISYHESTGSVNLELTIHPHVVSRLFPVVEQYNIETIRHHVSKMLYDLKKAC
jgi:hypothetical protein